ANSAAALLALPDVAQVMREIDEIVVGKRRQRLDHQDAGLAVPDAPAALESPQRFQQVRFALIREPRYLVGAGEIRSVADDAAVPARQRLAARKPSLVGCGCRRLPRRQPSRRGGLGAQ